jgi:hypothetical protein
MNSRDSSSAGAMARRAAGNPLCEATLRPRQKRGLNSRVDWIFHARDEIPRCRRSTGSRTVTWRALGQVGLMEARRLRDKFAAEVQGAQPVLARAHDVRGAGR